MAEHIYRIIISPVIIIIAHFMAIFKPKIREGLDQRKQVLSNIEKWIRENPGKSKRIIFHTASLGEFEHIKPLLTEIKQRYQTQNIVSFFSASGYDNANLNPGMDLRTYVPIESFKNWNRFYKLIQPSLLVVAKHDVWPAQIWAAKKLNIPTFLINASLSESSSRTNILVRKFLSNVYCVIDKIFTISEEDTQRFEFVYGINNVEFLGDTKYDQVVFRKRIAESQKILPAEWKQSSHCIVCGSVWPEDTEHLFPALKKILEENHNWKIILVPHEPHKTYVNDINKQFSKWGTKKFSERKNINKERVLVVDEIGHLAGLYHYSDIAYVGGSFKQGIHNSMEPAIFGVPVLYGPVHKNSYEAIQLARQNGGVVVHNKRDLFETLSELVLDEGKRNQLGEKALHFASANTGATEKLLDQWKNILLDNQ
jgi:3-deoxy-D-manno-octulosonic-acid transferase